MLCPACGVILYEKVAFWGFGRDGRQRDF